MRYTAENSRQMDFAHHFFAVWESTWQGQVPRFDLEVLDEDGQTYKKIGSMINCNYYVHTKQQADGKKTRLFITFRTFQPQKEED